MSLDKLEATVAGLALVQVWLSKALAFIDNGAILAGASQGDRAIDLVAVVLDRLEHALGECRIDKNIPFPVTPTIQYIDP